MSANLVTAASALILAALLMACKGDNDASPPASASPAETSTPGSTVSATAGIKVPSGVESLTVARIDLASRLDVARRRIQLHQVNTVGWNGCLGVTLPGAACAEIFVPGLIAWFQVENGDGQLYRYHLGGHRLRRRYR